MNITPTSTLILTGSPDIPGTHWPLTVYDLNQFYPNTTFGSEQPEENLTDFHVFLVRTSPKPEGDVVTEVEPKFIDGRWVQQWETRSFTDDEVKQNLAQAKNQAFNLLTNVLSATISKGFEHKDGDLSLFISLSTEDRLRYMELYSKTLNDTGSDTQYLLINTGGPGTVLTRQQMETLHAAIIKFIDDTNQRANEVFIKIDAAATITDVPEISYEI